MLASFIHTTKYLNLLSCPSLSRAPSYSYHSLFSISPAHSLHVSLFSQTQSLAVSLDTGHTLPISVDHSAFIISYVSIMLWCLSSYLALFLPTTHTLSPAFHFVSLFLGIYHAPHLFLDMTPTTKIYLSLSHTPFVGVSFPSSPPFQN